MTTETNKSENIINKEKDSKFRFIVSNDKSQLIKIEDIKYATKEVNKEDKIRIAFKDNVNVLFDMTMEQFIKALNF